MGSVERLGNIALGAELGRSNHIPGVRPRHGRRSLGIIVRNEHADHPVVPHEVRSCGLVHICGLDGSRLVAVNEEQPPVAKCNVLGQIDSKSFRVGERALKLGRLLLQIQRHLLLGCRILCKRRLDGVDQDLLDRFKVRPLGNQSAEHDETGVERAHGPAKDLARLAALDERLVQAPSGRLREDVNRRFHGAAVIGKGRGNSVADRHELHLALAADLELARPVRNRLDRPFPGKSALGPGDRAEQLADPAKNLVLVKLAGNRENGIVRLIPLAVEGLQILYGHVFDVASGADRAAPVCVPVKKHRLHALEHHGNGTILPHFIFIAHHGHLGVEILLRDEGIDHRIGAPAKSPAHVVVVRGEAHEVVRAVDPGRPVHAKAPARELLGGLRIILAALEHEVFKQVRHAGFAIIFHAGADQVGHVDRRRGLALIGKKNNLQSVVKLIAVNAFDTGKRLDARRAGCQGSCNQGSHHQCLQCHKNLNRAWRDTPRGGAWREDSAPASLIA